MPLYWLQENKWRIFTVWLIPVTLFFGHNDTGGSYAIEWLVCLILTDLDDMHGATYPPEGLPFWWKYLTHPLFDLISLPWKVCVHEHQHLYASSVDLLKQDEFGWESKLPLYWLQENKWWIFTVWLIPATHFFGHKDTGGSYAIDWLTCQFYTDLVAPNNDDEDVDDDTSTLVHGRMFLCFIETTGADNGSKAKSVLSFLGNSMSVLYLMARGFVDTTRIAFFDR
jgi:hypothetical protein